MSHPKRVVAPAIALALLLAYPAAAEKARPSVPGEKIDSGLGALPHYREWSKHEHLHGLAARVNAVPGEKLDSGLGALKHYRHWADNTGRPRDTMEVASRH